MFQKDKFIYVILFIFSFIFFQNDAISGNYWVNSNPTLNSKFKEHESECKSFAQKNVEDLDSMAEVTNLGLLALMTTVVGTSLGGQAGMSASSGMLEGYNNSNKNATSHQNEYSSFFIGCMDKKGWSIKNEQQIESQSKANKEKFLIANEYFMSRNWSSLIRFSNDWISIEPSNPSPYEWRALAKANLKDKSAIDDFRSNIFLSDQPTARQYKNLGLAYKNFDDEDMAKYQFKKCLKIDPNDNFCKDSLTSLNDKRISNNLSHSEGKPIFGSYKWEKNTSSLTVKVLQIDFYHDGVKIISEIKKGNDINHTESYGKVSWESKEEFHPTPDQIYYRYIIKPLKDNDIKTSNRKFSKIQIYVWAQKDIDKRGDIFMIEGNQLNNKIIPILSAGQLDL